MQKCNCNHHEDCPARDSPENPPRPLHNLVWGPNAAYAPGFPINDFQTRRPLPGVVEWRYVLSHQKSSLDSVPKTAKAALLSSIPERIYRDHLLPKLSFRHVRFDLPSLGKERKRENEKESSPHKNEQPTSSSHFSRRPNHHESRPHSPPKPQKQTPPHRSSSHTHHHTRSNPRPNPAPTTPSIPTIHLITYSVHHTLCRSDVDRILTKHLPRGTHHLYTIPAHRFTPPPEHICQHFSGVSPIVQNYVMQDPQASLAVKTAVMDIIAHINRKWDLDGSVSTRKVGEEGERDVAVGVCCTFGTHRSVGVAERIARGVEQWVGECAPGSVRVRVVHVHRVKGGRDPY
ncbi:hypothetical protein DM02DRAFT_731731 [Periconia macrospinosa]|uniref:RapZ C-terminal domain-containing protein n=1 Tax=Periconia macrospinosa TaxID=97972 RepID=A0A2V1DBV8_9PLEO|nr:hypothetical protein DM02DRAFT_731731 [Periconia macrospinosa]